MTDQSHWLSNKSKFRFEYALINLLRKDLVGMPLGDLIVITVCSNPGIGC